MEIVSLRCKLQRLLKLTGIMIMAMAIALNIGFLNVRADTVAEDTEDVYSVSYRVHVQKQGWQDYVSDGECAGTTGSGLRLEAINISVSSQLYEGGVYYRTHVQKQGWQGYVSDGALSGTSGKALRLEAIEIDLYGELADYYDIYYRVHVQSFGWLGWAKNGASSGSSGYSKRLECIQVKMVPKGESFDTGDKDAYYSSSNVPVVKYRTQVQKKGWLSWVTNKKISGTSGQSLGVEALQMYISNYKGVSGGIAYSSHVQKQGWQNYVTSNNISGTVGKSLRVEAIRIKLTGELNTYYDIYYRTYCQKFGWLGWACNGANAGTSGYGYRVEAIQVAIVHKKAGAPGSTLDAYKRYVATSSSSSGSTTNLDALASQAIALTNVQRNAYGVASLSTDSQLCTFAKIRAAELNSLFSHTRPDGSSCFTVLDSYTGSLSTAGENLAYGYASAADVINGWMNSQGHKENILESSFDRIGIGVAYINGNYYWCQIFVG